MGFIIGLALGVLLGVIILGIIAGGKEDEKPCETCKYQKIGVDILTGDLLYPCNSCCYRFPDLYSEKKQ